MNKLFKLLESQLESHDWFYGYSDDHRYYKSGSREHRQIWETIDKLSSEGYKVEAEQMYAKYYEQNHKKPYVPWWK
jgi:hypothetical protein